MRRRAFLSSTAICATAGCMGYTIERQAYVDSLEEQVDELEVRVADKASEKGALKSEIDTREDEIDALQREVAELEAAEAASRREIDALEAQIARHEAEIADIQARIAAITPEVTFTEDEIDSAVEAGRAVRDAVVGVFSHLGSATGFHLGNGEYLTADHVVSNGEGGVTWRELEFMNGVTARFHLSDDRDEGLDARIITANTTPGNTVEIGSLDAVSTDDVLFIVGNPFNVGRWVISIGRYLGSTRSGGFDELYETDAPVRRRSSGSPVFDIGGEVVGLAIVEMISHDGYDAPEDPFFSFAAYDTHAGFVSIDSIENSLGPF